MWIYLFIKEMAFDRKKEFILISLFFRKYIFLIKYTYLSKKLLVQVKIFNTL